jgi:tripartite-type tricarboxylate transporter receptor subunit TctC
VVNLVYGVYLNPTVPAKNIAELTAYLKANPSKLNYATGPLGEYMMAAHYLKATGTQAARIPYKGGAQIMPDLITGQVQLNFGPLAAGLPHVRAGKLRLLATVPQRMSGVQDVPSLNEAGIPTDDIPLWNGLMAPPNTPREIASRIAMEVAKALKNPELLKSLEAQGLMAVGGTPEAMNTAIQSATQSWRNFIRDYDIPQE